MDMLIEGDLEMRVGRPCDEEDQFGCAPRENTGLGGGCLEGDDIEES
jgi:hypothetical protein